MLLQALIVTYAGTLPFIYARKIAIRQKLCNDPLLWFGLRRVYSFEYCHGHVLPMHIRRIRYPA